jgi:hypothetical protein
MLNTTIFPFKAKNRAVKLFFLPKSTSTFALLIKATLQVFIKKSYFVSYLHRQKQGRIAVFAVSDFIFFAQKAAASSQLYKGFSVTEKCNSDANRVPKRDIQTRSLRTSPYCEIYPIYSKKL